MSRVLLLLLLLFAHAGWAQEDSGPEEAKTEPPAEEPETQDSDPFDYQSSEKISEDLSVSFPVDI